MTIRGESEMKLYLYGSIQSEILCRVCIKIWGVCKMFLHNIMRHFLTTLSSNANFYHIHAKNKPKKSTPLPAGKRWMLLNKLDWMKYIQTSVLGRKVMFNTSITGLSNLRIVGTKADLAELRIAN